MMRMRSNMELGAKLVRRHWLGLVSGLFLTLVLLVGSPAWAAPTASKLNQTVPRPTATPDNQPFPTPTARPDNDDDEEVPTPTAGEPLEDEVEEVAPLFFLEAPGEESLTASVLVNNLNVRDGAGAGFVVIGSLARGTVVDVLARNEDGSWWYICCMPDTTTEGWVSSELVEPDFERTEAAELVPVFGVVPPPSIKEAPIQVAEEIPTLVKQSAAPVASAELPLVLKVSQSPPFVWQGQRVSLEFVIENPNVAQISNVELSNELPSDLFFVDAGAGVDGRVNQQATDSGAILVLASWPKIPAGGTVAATITVKVSPDLPDAAVIDNLVAVRANNGVYTTGGISIGMPPTELPDFQ